MRPQYAALVAIFLDAVVAVNFKRGAEDIFLQNQLERRADNTTTIAAPINVEPSQYWEGNDGPWSSFALQVGTPKQNIRVMISTAAFNVWTVNADDGCPNGTISGCENSRGQPFLTNESLTWIQNSIWDLGIEQNLGYDSTAYYGFDTVTLGWQGSGLPTVSRTVMTNFADDKNVYWLGLFGLNPMSTNFSTFNDPQLSFLSQLKNNNTIPSLSWSYTAGNPYRNAGDEYGSLVLGGYDQSKFDPTNVTTSFGSDVSRDLVIYVDEITTTASATALSSSTQGFYAFIDSTVPHLWLPLEVCEAFEAAFGLIWDETTELYLVNDTLHASLKELDADVTLTLGSSSSSDGGLVDITMPYSAFDLQVSYPIVGNTSYYFPLKRAANSTQYTLGRAFLQEAYLIADYERRNFTIAPCKWDDNSDTDIHTILSVDTVIPNTTSDSSISGGVIAGIVIGVIAAIALLCLALFFLRRKRNGQKKRIAELEAKSPDGNASDASNGYDESATKPFISAPIGGELGNDGAVHEMQGQHKPAPAEIDTQYGGSQTGTYDFYNGDPKAVGTLGTSTMGGVGTWRSGISEVEGNNEPIYEMPGSDVQELPDSRRQSWADGDENTISTKGRV